MPRAVKVKEKQCFQDGTGLCDCMVSEDDADQQADRAIDSITLETSAAPATKPHPFAEP